MDPSQVTPEWLTQALRESGHLPRGAVAGVQATTEPSYTSTIARLTLTYTHDAPPGAPTRLFLKWSRLDAQQRAVGGAQRRKEVEFHTAVAAMMPDPPLAHCYLAAYYEETGASHLLFDDMSETHFGGASSRPPDRPRCEAVMDAFAAFHAFWWDHPALPDLGDYPSQASIAADVADVADHLPRFADALGDRLTPSQRLLYDRALGSLPRLLQRKTQGRRLTLIHGDANLSNVLLPRDAGGRALIIDWQMWGIGFGAEDLSNLMALFWGRDDRRALERGLLARYHAGLAQHGVADYSWLDCWHDYRLAAVTRVLFMPMWFWATGQPPAQFENAWQAFADLECAELLTL